MKLSDFSYELPKDLIAQKPPDKRDSARLMVLDRSADSVCDRTFRDVLEYVSPGDCLVLNDTKVLPVRNQSTAGQLLFNATSPYEMTFGVVDTKRYIKVGVVCSDYDAAVTFAIDTVMDSLEGAFTKYDPYVVSDGLP